MMDNPIKRKEQLEVKLVKQIQTICDFINNRPEIFKGIYGGVDKIITEYAERKKQECEKLKTQILSLQTMEIEELKKLKQECEELKQEKAEIKKYLGISSKTIMQRLEELQEFKDKLKISEDNYKQALTDIEKYVSNRCGYYIPYGALNIILGIINKAKDGE